MKKLILTVLVFGFLGFSSASAFEFKNGDKIIFSTSGKKTFLIVERSTEVGFISYSVFKNQIYKLEFLKIDTDIYKVVIYEDENILTARYYKKNEDDIFISYAIDAKMYLSKDTFFTTSL